MKKKKIFTKKGRANRKLKPYKLYSGISRVHHEWAYNRVYLVETTSI